MHFLKKHIKPISIAIISVGSAISLGGFIAFLVTGTNTIVKLTDAKTDTKTNKTDYVTASYAAGWLNYDTYYWTVEANLGKGKIDEHGKTVNFTYSDFLKYVNDSTNIQFWNLSISSFKDSIAALNKLSDIPEVQVSIKKLQYEIDYYQAFLNVNANYNGAIAGCVLFPAGILLALLVTGILIYSQKRMPLDK